MNMIVSGWFIENSMSIMSVIVAVMGLCYGLYQWRKSTQVKRAEFVFNIYEKLRLEKDTMNAMYMIDYEKSWYEKDFHSKEKNRDSDKEYGIDRLLSILSYICYLRKEGCIEDKEFLLFKYDIDRVSKSYQCQNYMWNVYHFSKDELHTSCPYNGIIEYAIISGMLPKDIFYSPEEGFYRNFVDFIVNPNDSNCHELD